MSDKKHQLLLADLHSIDKSVVLETIETLRDKGKMESIEALVQLVEETKDEDIRQAALLFLYDVKNPEYTKVLLNCIKKASPKKHLAALISVFWQAGLNIDEQFEYFFDLVVSSDFHTAFESYTVIDNNMETISEEHYRYANEKLSMLLKQEENKEKLIKSLQALLAEKYVG